MGIKDAGLPLVESLPALFVSGFILAMANATSNIMNQVYDAEMDALNPKKQNRPIPSQEIHPVEAMSFAFFLMLLTIVLALMLFGTSYGLSLSVILLFCWVYNCPPFRFKERFILSNVAIAAPRGGLGITCAYSAFANPFNPVMYVAMVYFALYVFGTNTLKDFADYEYDRIFGVRNFVTVWGKAKASEFVCYFTVIPFFFLSLATIFVDLSIWTFTPLVFSGAIVYLLLRNPEMQSKTENNMLWTMFYLQFASMMILYVLPRVL